MLILSINLVLACKYIGQSKKKCFKISKAPPHRQDGSDTIPTQFTKIIRVFFINYIKNVDASFSSVSQIVIV